MGYNRVMDQKPTSPPFPNQKLLAAPREILKKAGQDFLDFSHTASDSNHKLIGWAVLAVVLVAGFFILSPVISNIVSSQNNLIQGYIPVSSAPKSMNMEIQNPDDELLVFNNTVVVSGKTTPKSSVVIINGQDQLGTEADKDGNFQKVVDLQPGINPIQILAFDTEGNSKSDSRTVYYSEEKL